MNRTTGLLAATLTLSLANTSHSDQAFQVESAASEGHVRASCPKAPPAPVSPPPAVQRTRRPAINWGNGKAYLFKGNQYIRYDIASGIVDQGWPKLISEQWKGVWKDGIDAAIKWGKKVYFFKGAEYLRYDIQTDSTESGYPKSIATEWPGLWGGGIDSAIDWGNGKAYFFKGDEYSRYDIATEKLDSGYPAKMANAWHGLPARPIDSSFLWGKKAFFFYDNQYYMYDIATDAVDVGYPLPIDANTWPGML